MLDAIAQSGCLACDRCIAPDRDVDAVILAADDQPPIARAAHIEVWPRRFPDQAVAQRTEAAFDGLAHESVAAAIVCDRLREMVLAFVARGEHEMPASDRSALSEFDVDAAASRVECGHRRAVVHVPAAAHDPTQQPACHLVRIDFGSDHRQQRHGCVDAEAFAGLRSIQYTKAEAVRAAQLRFREQARAMVPVARVVEAAHAAHIDAAQLAREPNQCGDRLLAAAIGEHGIRFAEAIAQLLQLGVDFVLQEARARGRAAPGRLASIDHADIQARAGEAIGDQRACDAGAHDEDIAMTICAQCGERTQQAVLDDPVGIAALQVHARIPLGRSGFSSGSASTTSAFTSGRQ